MTPEEFYKQIAKISGPTEITLSPGPLVLKVNCQDAMASRLLLWLEEQMPEEATVGDLFDVLDAAHWWATFWSSLRDTARGRGGNRKEKL